MNKRFIGVLTFAFIVALGASVVLYRVLLTGRQQQAKAAPAMAQVALANRDLEVGTVLKEDDIKVAEWPGAIPVGATTRKEDLIGRGVITTIFAKEPIIESRLAAKGAGGGMAALIPPGMRAVAVRVNEIVGVAGFIGPGTHVDILISGSSPGQNNNLGTQTQTLLQNIEILSANQEFKKDAEGKPVAAQVVNLLVTPAQAEMVSLAAAQTSIQLVLRNPLDHDLSKTPGTAVHYLFQNGKPQPAPQSEAPARPRQARPAAPPVQAAPAPPKETPFVMEIINGKDKKEQKFAPGQEAK